MTRPTPRAGRRRSRPRCRRPAHALRPHRHRAHQQAAQVGRGVAREQAAAAGEHVARRGRDAAERLRQLRADGEPCAGDVPLDVVRAARHVDDRGLVAFQQGSQRGRRDLVHPRRRGQVGRRAARFGERAGRRRIEHVDLPAHLRQPGTRHGLRARRRRRPARCGRPAPAHGGRSPAPAGRPARWRSRAGGRPRTPRACGRRSDRSCGPAHPAKGARRGRSSGGPRAARRGGASACACASCAGLNCAGARRPAPWSSVWPASFQPIVPLRSAATGLGMPAFTSDCAPMMLRVRPAQLTITCVAGSGASARTRSTSSAPGTLVAVGMFMVWYSSKRRTSSTTRVRAGVDQRLDLGRRQRGRVPLVFDEFAEGLARHVDVAEQFAARGAPAFQAAFEQMDAGVAQRREPGGGARREVFSVVFAVQHERRVAARDTAPGVEVRGADSGRLAAHSGCACANGSSSRTSSSAVSSRASRRARTAAKGREGMLVMRGPAGGVRRSDPTDWEAGCWNSRRRRACVRLRVDRYAGVPRRCSRHRRGC